MKALVLLALGACGSGKQQAPADPAPVIAAAHELAERACTCDTDKDCVHAVRDAWDAQKDQLLAARLTGDDKTKLDAELQRLKACGDAAGLTFWDH